MEDECDGEIINSCDVEKVKTESEEFELEDKSEGEVNKSFFSSLNSSDSVLTFSRSYTLHLSAST